MAIIERDEMSETAKHYENEAKRIDENLNKEWKQLPQTIKFHSFFPEWIYRR